MNPLRDLKNAATYNGIEHRICEIITDIPKCDNMRLCGKFFYLKFRDGKITDKEFAKYVYDKIIHYCIPQKNKEAAALYVETGEERYLLDLHDQAKNLLAQSQIRCSMQAGETTTTILNHIEFAIEPYKSKLTSANVMDNVLTLPETETVGWQT